MTNPDSTIRSFSDPHRGLSEAFAELASQDLLGAPLKRAAGAFVSEVVNPYFDGTASPESLEDFDASLRQIERGFDIVARDRRHQIGRLATRLVDGIEEHVLETRIFPAVFPSRGVYRDLGSLSFRGIGKVNRYAEQYGAISSAGYARILHGTSAHEMVALAGRGDISLESQVAAHEKIRDRFDGPALAENQVKDDRFDAQLSKLASRYVRQMGRLVSYGPQYSQYLQSLSHATKSSVRDGRTAAIVRTQPRGDTELNLVAKVRHGYLEPLFARLD